MECIKYIKVHKDKFWRVLKMLGIEIISGGSVDGTTLVKYKDSYYELWVNYDRLSKDAYIKSYSFIEEKDLDRYYQSCKDNLRGWSI